MTGLVLGPLGLVWRGRTWVQPTTIRVFPQVQFDGKDGLFLRGQLQSRASVRVNKQRAQTGEIHALRDHAEGDDVRLMHWAATARRGHPVVREMEWERYRQVVLLLDGGRSMGAFAGRSRGARPSWTRPWPRRSRCSVLLPSTTIASPSCCCERGRMR